MSCMMIYVLALSDLLCLHFQSDQALVESAKKNVAGLGLISMTTNTTCHFLPVCCLSALKVLNLSCRQGSQLNPFSLFRMNM